MTQKVDPTKFGRKFKELLKKAGCTQKDFAEAMGVSAYTVSQWVKGSAQPKWLDKADKFFYFFYNGADLGGGRKVKGDVNFNPLQLFGIDTSTQTKTRDQYDAEITELNEQIKVLKQKAYYKPLPEQFELQQQVDNLLEELESMRRKCLSETGRVNHYKRQNKIDKARYEEELARIKSEYDQDLKYYWDLYQKIFSEFELAPGKADAEIAEIIRDTIEVNKLNIKLTGHYKSLAGILQEPRFLHTLARAAELARQMSRRGSIRTQEDVDHWDVRILDIGRQLVRSIPELRSTFKRESPTSS